MIPTSNGIKINLSQISLRLVDSKGVIHVFQDTLDGDSCLRSDLWARGYIKEVRRNGKDKQQESLKDISPCD